MCSEEQVTSVFKVKELAKREPSMKQTERKALKTVATRFSETAVDFQRTIWRYIPEGKILQINIKFEKL
jgi:hypothetical protein